MDPLEQLKRHIEATLFHKRNIENVGISIMSMRDAMFSYTIGASRSGLPDMIGTNIPPATALYTFNVLFNYWKYNGFQDGRIPGLFESKDGEKDMAIYVKLVDYDDHLIDRYVTQAHNFYLENPEYVHPKHGIRFVQVFYPDENGRTQFEPGFNMQYHQILVEQAITRMQ